MHRLAMVWIESRMKSYGSVTDSRKRREIYTERRGDIYRENMCLFVTKC